MASDLNRGAYSGKETFFYYNDGTHAAPDWKLIARARNITKNQGPDLSDVNFHGTSATSQIPGYEPFNGQFEYVRSKATDAVMSDLEAARDGGAIIELMHLDGPQTDPNSKGWMAPCILGQFAQNAAGGDAVVETIPFSMADAYDGTGNQIVVQPATGEAPGP